MIYRGEERPDFDARRGDLARAAGQLEQATAPSAARPADPLVRDAVAGRPRRSLDRPGLPRRADRPGPASRGGFAGPRSRASTGSPTRGSSCLIPDAHDECRRACARAGCHPRVPRASCRRRLWPVCCRAGSIWPSVKSSATAGPARRIPKPTPSPGPGWPIFWAMHRAFDKPRRRPAARCAASRADDGGRWKSRPITRT